MKQSSLLDPFVSYEENEVLQKWPLNYKILMYKGKVIIINLITGWASALLTNNRLGWGWLAVIYRLAYYITV